MESLSNLLTKVPARLRKDVLASCVVFPRTKSLSEDRPAATREVEGSWNYDELETWIRSHTEFISLIVRDDLLLTFRVLREIHEELQLEKFDCVQIYRGGLDVLHIVNRGRETGRSAYVEINDYRRRLHMLLHPDRNDLWVAIISAVIAATGALAFNLILSRMRKG